MADQLATDLGPVNWGATAKLSLARGVAAATVWCVVMLFMHAPLGSIPRQFILLVPTIAIGAPLYHLMVRGIKAVLGGLPFVGLACNLILLICALVVAAGDPIVFALNKRFPDLLGIADFKPFNLVPAIFVHQ